MANEIPFQPSMISQTITIQLLVRSKDDPDTLLAETLTKDVGILEWYGYSGQKNTLGFRFRGDFRNTLVNLNNYAVEVYDK
jgi:hypothetical protein